MDPLPTAHQGLRGISHSQSGQHLWHPMLAENTTHTELFEKAGITPAESLLLQRQLVRWLRHVIRMPNNNRLPRRLLYGELTVGQHSVGRPKKRFIDNIKANLLKCNIKPSDLEALASSRDIWRTVCDSGLRSFLTGWITASEERRAARHAASTKPAGPQCPQCNRVCSSEFGLRSHMQFHVKSSNT